MPMPDNPAFASLLRRLVPRAALGVVIGVVAVLLGGRAAHADVMEVGGGGWHWVTGGGAMTGNGNTPARAAAQPLPQGTPLAGVPPRWRPLVGRLAERYDLSPAIIAALIWQESRWHPHAVSLKGARGLAQLMPATARGLGVNPDDDAANIEAGARYLRQLANAFHGDLEKALAAYNAGPGRVARAGGIPPIAETRAYVAAIFAHLSVVER